MVSLGFKFLTIPHQCTFGPRHHCSVLIEAQCIVLPLQCSWQYIFYRLEVHRVNRSRCFVYNLCLHCCTALLVAKESTKRETEHAILQSHSIINVITITIIIIIIFTSLNNHHFTHLPSSTSPSPDVKLLMKQQLPSRPH